MITFQNPELVKFDEGRSERLRIKGMFEGIPSAIGFGDIIREGFDLLKSALIERGMMETNKGWTFLAHLPEYPVFTFEAFPSEEVSVCYTIFNPSL